jgi:glutamate:GABA antiporter
MSAITGPRPRKRVMGFVDVTLFIISAILVVDQLTASASIGVSSVGWWVITVILFFVPSAVIVAELGTTYPYQGGIYDWVNRAFGRRWAARTTYWYWVNVALWMPSVYLLFTGVLTGLVWTNASVFQQSLVAIALSWITVLVGMQTLRIGKSVTNGGAVVKAAIILIIGIGGAILAARHGSANSFTLHGMLPDFGVAKLYLPVLVYQLLGFELVSSLSGEIKNPRRDISRAILFSGVLISALYVLGTVGILLVLPLKTIGLTAGLVQTFQAIFGAHSALPWILGLAVMAAYFGNMVTWTLGANKSAVEAAEAGELPKLFGSETKRGTPKWAYLLTGIVSTVVLLIAGLFIKNQNNLYFALFAASSVIFLLPYLLMFPATIRLRRIDPDRERPFKVPGGAIGLWACVALATVACAASLVLFLWTPGAPVAWSYTGPLIGIAMGAIVAGEIVVAWCMRRLRTAPPAESAGGEEMRNAA